MTDDARTRRFPKRQDFLITVKMLRGHIISAKYQKVFIIITFDVRDSGGHFVRGVRGLATCSRMAKGVYFSTGGQ